MHFPYKGWAKYIASISKLINAVFSVTKTTRCDLITTIGPPQINSFLVLQLINSQAPGWKNLAYTGKKLRISSRSNFLSAA